MHAVSQFYLFPLPLLLPSQRNDDSHLIANMGSSETDDLLTNAIQSNLASWPSDLQPLALQGICNRSLRLNYHCPFGTLTF